MTIYPPSLIDQFERLFRPRLVIRVFRDLEGFQFAAVQLPRTHQLVIGMSAPLFHHVADHIFEQTGRQVEKEFKVEHVRGAMNEIVLPQPLSAADIAGEAPLPFAPQYEVLRLAPKPV